MAELLTELEQLRHIKARLKTMCGSVTINISPYNIHDDDYKEYCKRELGRKIGFDLYENGLIKFEEVKDENGYGQIIGSITVLD